jgi:hypothetical protein
LDSLQFEMFEVEGMKRRLTFAAVLASALACVILLVAAI